MKSGVDESRKTGTFQGHNGARNCLQSEKSLLLCCLVRPPLWDATNDLYRASILAIGIVQQATHKPYVRQCNVSLAL